jgi:uncharacterized membrane protein YeaQ/YmgE (transglycosylase-associated protein family)
LIIGAIVGWLAGLVMKGRGFGLFGNIVIGVIGALVGGYLAAILLKIPNAISGFNLTTFIVSFVGALIVLLVVRLLSGRRGWLFKFAGGNSYYYKYGEGDTEDMKKEDEDTVETIRNEARKKAGSVNDSATDFAQAASHAVDGAHAKTEGAKKDIINGYKGIGHDAHKTYKNVSNELFKKWAGRYCDLEFWALRHYQPYLHTERASDMSKMKLSGKLGMKLLGVWLVITGLLQVTSLQIPYIGIIMAILVIAAGVLILFDRWNMQFYPLNFQRVRSAAAGWNPV